MVMYLHHLPHSKKNVPVMIPDPVALIKDIRLLVVTHKDDCPNRACNGKYVLRWNETDDVEGGKRGRKTKAPGQIPKPSGLVTNSIIFRWLFTKHIKVCVTVDYFTASWDLHAWRDTPDGILVSLKLQKQCSTR